MSEILSNFWLRFLNACGIDRFSWLEAPGLAVVIIAFGLVIYAFYKATQYSIWPYEPHYENAKRSIFDELEEDAQEDV